MKQIILSIATALLCIFFTATATAQGIAFFKGTYDEGLQKAKTEGKILFVDFYTEWCAPCQLMKETVFPDKNAGEYFNTHFVNMQLNAEAPENEEIVKKMKITSYPALLFIRPDGKMQLMHNGALSAEELVSKAKVATGEEMGFEEIYDKYRANKKNLAIQQQLLLQAPGFVATQERLDAKKWISRVNRIYKDYIKAKKRAGLINKTDYRIITTYFDNADPDIAIVDFINDHFDEWRNEVGDAPAYFIIEYNDGMARKLAEAGNIKYKEYLNNIGARYKKAYDINTHIGMTPAEKATTLYDAIYTIYAKKDADAYLEMMNAYIAKLGEGTTPANYGEAAQILYYATKGDVSEAAHRQAIQWLHKALEYDGDNIIDKINITAMLGDSYKATKEYDKAQQAYNHAYLLTLQLDKMEITQISLQMAIKQKLAELELLRQ